MTDEDRGVTLIVLWAVALILILILVLGAEWWVGR